MINVGRQRLGTSEIEARICSHPNVSEVAVVDVEDKLKGEATVAFVILPYPATTDGVPALQAEIMAIVDRQLGAVARPAQAHIVSMLSKTRSGKLLQREIQGICESRDPSDLTTLEDPALV